MKMMIAGTAHCAYLAERVLTLIPRLKKEIPGVREGEDIEHIHRMRVASRRIRATLALFEGCLRDREFRRMRRSVRGITRALGEARDADVQIAFLASYAARIPPATTIDPLSFGPPEGFEPVVTSPDEKPFSGERMRSSGERMGVQCLLLRLVQEREALQPDVIRGLDRLEDSMVLERMTERLARRVERWSPAPCASEPSGFVSSAAQEAVAVRADALAALAPALADPARLADHHAMRIAAKRLRYTLETYGPLFEDELRSEVKVIKALQEVLGDLHDCDVWIERLPRFLEEERARTLAYFGNEGLIPGIEQGVTALLEDRRSERARLHGTALNAWNRLDQERFLEHLVKRFALVHDHERGVA